jgi:hypothetical protein
MRLCKTALHLLRASLARRANVRMCVHVLVVLLPTAFPAASLPLTVLPLTSVTCGSPAVGYAL